MKLTARKKKKRLNRKNRCVCRPPSDLRAYQPGIAREEVVDSQLHCTNAVLADLKQHLATTQNRMVIQYNKKHRDQEFKECEWVYLRKPPHGLNPSGKKKGHKMSPRFVGPCQIKKRVGSLAYELKLPEGSLIHHKKK
ncbi:hypothetical protein EJ110_NYTH52998 [Nymphaea thermarum]|nr:hypothetical protein EJ110_NYTH52998 [Nymphaea thermarum]